MYSTERPDAVASKLLEGRVAVLVDGSPFVIVVPSLMIEFFKRVKIIINKLTLLLYYGYYVFCFLLLV